MTRVTVTASRSATVQAESIPPPAVAFEDVSLAFDDHVVLRDLSFVVPKGATRILLGASGAGKSLVLKLMLGLLRPDSGTIVVHGQRVDRMDEDDLLRLRADIGMLFQENALFDSSRSRKRRLRLTRPTCRGSAHQIEQVSPFVDFANSSIAPSLYRAVSAAVSPSPAQWRPAEPPAVR